MTCSQSAVGRKRRLDQAGDGKEADSPGEKRCHSHFIGGIEHGAGASALRQDFASELERGKSLLIRGFEAERAERGQIEALGRSMHALGPGQAIGDGRAHIGAGHLREDRPVTQMHEAMHDRLRMDQNVELVRREPEEVMRFQQLEPLVHQRGRIDRDLGAHRPVGVVETPARVARHASVRGSTSGRARPKR